MLSQRVKAERGLLLNDSRSGRGAGGGGHRGRCRLAMQCKYNDHLTRGLRLTNDELHSLILAHALAVAEQLEQVVVLLETLAADALPVDTRTVVRSEEVVLENVVRNVGELGTDTVLVRMEPIELDALRHHGLARVVDVVVAEPDRGRDIGFTYSKDKFTPMKTFNSPMTRRIAVCSHFPTPCWRSSSTQKLLFTFSPSHFSHHATGRSLGSTNPCWKMYSRTSSR